ncbi:MAG: glycosyltransferase [Magnetococcales bacterium]|nr:glycosyltransferase [Magnetococcales bacterium]MBF0149401.1 glycosyltransferase [Magnetococcales bacterium]MBF0171951.1 glycosyltransferase [Magnetococcales bacterium]
MPQKLSIVIPCFNEEKTLTQCVHRVLAIADDELDLELIIVDDASSDASLALARELAGKHPQVMVCHHEVNQGKGAALRTGFKHATGDYVAVQDADLEYDPRDLKQLIQPMRQGLADVVFGSRFLFTGCHRVLYFWHAMGNRFLTFLSNMFTDLNLTDMETCYKVFKREIIQQIDIQENRFGFEPEIVAKVADLRLRVYEMGISYHGRTYDEGKKIGIRDGFRALYCILHYNSHKAPVPLQFLIYLFIGGLSAAFNLIVFLLLLGAGVALSWSAPIAFVLAAVLNYLLCILLLFRHRAQWSGPVEVVLYSLLVVVVGGADLWMTTFFMGIGLGPAKAKLIATLLGLVLNFAGRRLLIFSEKGRGNWLPQRDLKEP